MNDESTDPIRAPSQVDPPAEPATADGESRVEHVTNSVKHAVESVVEKVSDTLHGHKGDA
jgi:hypothetical protein